MFPSNFSILSPSHSVSRRTPQSPSLLTTLKKISKTTSQGMFFSPRKCYISSSDSRRRRRRRHRRGELVSRARAACLFHRVECRGSQVWKTTELRANSGVGARTSEEQGRGWRGRGQRALLAPARYIALARCNPGERMRSLMKLPSGGAIKIDMTYLVLFRCALRCDPTNYYLRLSLFVTRNSIVVSHTYVAQNYISF